MKVFGINEGKRKEKTSGTPMCSVHPGIRSHPTYRQVQAFQSTPFLKFPTHSHTFPGAPAGRQTRPFVGTVVRLCPAGRACPSIGRRIATFSKPRSVSLPIGRRRPPLFLPLPLKRTQPDAAIASGRSAILPI